MLKQVGGDGKEHSIAYYSKKFLKHEENYAITELKYLAIVSAVDKRHCYLHGKRSRNTDHAALQWLKMVKKPAVHLFRWSLKLFMYDRD